MAVVAGHADHAARRDVLELGAGREQRRGRGRHVLLPGEQGAGRVEDGDGADVGRELAHVGDGERGRQGRRHGVRGEYGGMGRRPTRRLRAMPRALAARH